MRSNLHPILNSIPNSTKGRNTKEFRMDNMSEGGEFAGELDRMDGRQHVDFYNPIVFYLGWLLIAYVGLFVATVYIGPAVFGTRPFRPFYDGYKRKRRSLSSEGTENLWDLASRVYSALEKFNQE